MSILRSNKTPLGIGPGSGVPAAPTGLQIPSGSDTQNNLDWNDNNPTGLLSYRIYRSIAGGPFSLLTTITGSPPVSGGANTGLTPSTLYSYYVTAVNSVGESAPSNTASRTTDAAPAPGTPAYISSLVPFQARLLTGANGPAATANQTLRNAILALDPNQVNSNYPNTTTGPEEQLVYSGGTPLGNELYCTGAGHSATASDGLTSFNFGPDANGRPIGFVCKFVTPVSQQNNGTPPYASGSGSAIHTYASMCTLDGMIYKGGAFTLSNQGAPFLVRFNPATGLWQSPAFPLPGNFSVNICIPDPVSKKILCLDRWTGNFTFRFFRTVASPVGSPLTYAANTWSTIQANPGSRQWPMGAAIYRPNAGGLTGTVLVAGNDANQPGSSRFTVDWANETISNMVGLNLGALTTTGAPAIVYDPDFDLIWGAAYIGGGPNLNRIYWVDPLNNYAVNSQATTGDSITVDSSTDNSAQSPYNRIILLKAYNALGFITQRNGPATVVRIPSVRPS